MTQLGGSDLANVRHADLRDPALVMRLARLGSMHQCRLSFMRILTRRMAAENWKFKRSRFDIDTNGVGIAVYSAQTSDRTYSLVAFAHNLPADQRSDRVIAQAWDATFTLFDGVPTDADITRLSQNVPRQEAGRVSQSELSLSRANRSVRMWDYVTGCLAKGEQPDMETVAKVGYLMRTTAVYGSGKFGAADREDIADRTEFSAPFQAEMLSVYLTRWFVRDLADHMGQVQGGDTSVKLAPAIARALGIGNSTGLGMAPFILNHPVLFNNWIQVREEAIARVRSFKVATIAEIGLFTSLLDRSVLSADLWKSGHPVQQTKLATLRQDLSKLQIRLQSLSYKQKYPWNILYLWSEANLSLEGQECLASLILEPYGDLVDGLDHCMSDSADQNTAIDGQMSVAQARTLLEQHYDWALAIDWSKSDANARAWYVSEEKLEPRLGERFEEPIAEYEQPLSPARDAERLYQTLRDLPAEQTLAEFLLTHPEHRHILRRVQTVARAPYAEIRDNTISSTVLPIDMLRCKLGFFGAIHFDPRSDRWVRICMYANAPYPEDLLPETAEFWAYPEISEAGQ